MMEKNRVSNYFNRFKYLNYNNILRYFLPDSLRLSGMKGCVHAYPFALFLHIPISSDVICTINNFNYTLCYRTDVSSYGYYRGWI